MSETPASSATPTHPVTGVCAACGQRVRSDDDRKRKRFFWGVALAWLPFLPLIVALVKEALRGISEQKATGLGAVAGGFVQVGVIYFLVLAPVCVISAFVLLLRSFSRAHPARAIIAVVSLCWTALMGTMLALFTWLAIAYPH